MNLKKKVVAMGMVCALALGMATSAFAAEQVQVLPRATPNKLYHVHVEALGDSDYYLNTSSGVADYDNVNVWWMTGDLSQLWDFIPTSGGYYRVGVSKQPRRCLNIIRSTNNCTILDFSQNAAEDYNVKFVDESAQGGMQTYGLVLAKHPTLKALQTDSINLTTGTNVSWGTPGSVGNQRTQLWRLS